MERVSGNVFLSNINSCPVIDVRSPAEYLKGHISGAINIPIFTDEERHEIGIIYKNWHREAAIERGLEIVGPKMRQLADNAKNLSKNKFRKIYCWRGGMRSEKMAWLFELIGMECQVLEGGYKAYRNQQIEDFNSIKHLYIIHGSTGCGKTSILNEMEQKGAQVIDLEALAHHRGSVFGHINMMKQPTSQQFQNNVHQKLKSFDLNKPVWLEGESLKIGSVNLPDTLWDRMKSARVIEIKINRNTRLKRLVNEYGQYPKKELNEALISLQSYISKNKIDQARYFLNQNNLYKTADILLDYYDRTYEFTRRRFRNRSVAIIESATGDAKKNTDLILKALKNNNESNK